MISKTTCNLIILLTLVLSNCVNKKILKFKLPNGDIIAQTSVKELRKENKIHYEQYLGFVLEYHDSLFNQALLMLKNNDNIVGADVLTEDKISKLGLQTVEAIKFTYTFPGISKQRNLPFELFVKGKYNDFDDEIKLDEGFELKKSGKPYVKVSLHTFAIPNYSVILYPAELQ